MDKPQEILLINPPTIEERTENAQPVPLGLYSIQNILSREGFRVSILNLSNCKTWSDVTSCLGELKNVFLVGITCYTRQRFSVIRLAGEIKKVNNRCKIAVGGPHASFLDISLLRQCINIDYITRGEGEYTVLELARYIASHLKSQSESKFDEVSVEGVTYRNGNSIIRNSDRKLIEDLDNIPLIVVPPDDLHYLTMSESLLFHFPNIKVDDKVMAPIITSRGCEGRCLFCCNKAYWGGTRCHSGEYVVKQLYYYYEKGIRYFDIYDDNFTANIKAIRYMHDVVRSHKLDIHYWCSSRADYINESTVRLLKESGCFMISLGAESGSQVILDGISKNISVSRIVESCKIIERANLCLRLTISIGHKGETLETINETIDLLNKVKPTQIALYILKVYPGTPLYLEMVENKQLSDDYWEDPHNPIVPFYTVDHSINTLNEYIKRIEESIQGTIIRRYQSELGSVELSIRWG